MHSFHLSPEEAEVGGLEVCISPGQLSKGSQKNKKWRFSSMAECPWFQFPVPHTHTLKVKRVLSIRV